MRTQPSQDPVDNPAIDEEVDDVDELVVSRQASPRSRGVMGAAALGLGSIFQPNTKAEDHWADVPRIELVVTEEQLGRSQGLDLDYTGVPAAAALATPRRRWMRRPRWLSRRG